MSDGFRIGRVIQLPRRVELSAMIVIGMVRNLMDWFSTPLKDQTQQVWNLTVSEETSGLDENNFVLSLKTILWAVVLFRFVTKYIHFVFYLMMAYSILAKNHPEWILPWLYLTKFKNLFIEPVSIVVGVWLFWIKHSFRLIIVEFVAVQIISMVPSIYLCHVASSYYTDLCEERKIFDEGTPNPVVGDPDDLRLAMALAQRRRTVKSMDTIAIARMSLERRPKINSFSTIAEYVPAHLDDSLDSPNPISQSLTTLVSLSSSEDSNGTSNDRTSLDYIEDLNLTPGEKSRRILNLDRGIVGVVPIRVHETISTVGVALTESSDELARVSGPEGSSLRDDPATPPDASERPSALSVAEGTISVYSSDEEDFDSRSTESQESCICSMGSKPTSEKQMGQSVLELGDVADFGLRLQEEAIRWKKKGQGNVRTGFLERADGSTRSPVKSKALPVSLEGRIVVPCSHRVVGRKAVEWNSFVRMDYDSVINKTLGKDVELCKFRKDLRIILKRFASPGPEASSVRLTEVNEPPDPCSEGAILIPEQKLDPVEKYWNSTDIPYREGVQDPWLDEVAAAKDHGRYDSNRAGLEMDLESNQTRRALIHPLASDSPHSEKSAVIPSDGGLSSDEESISRAKIGTDISGVSDAVMRADELQKINVQDTYTIFTQMYIIDPLDEIRTKYEAAIPEIDWSSCLRNVSSGKSKYLESRAAARRASISGEIDNCNHNVTANLHQQHIGGLLITKKNSRTSQQMDIHKDSAQQSCSSTMNIGKDASSSESQSSTRDPLSDPIDPAFPYVVRTSFSRSDRVQKTKFENSSVVYDSNFSHGARTYDCASHGSSSTSNYAEDSLKAGWECRNLHAEKVTMISIIPRSGSKTTAELSKSTTGEWGLEAMREQSLPITASNYSRSVKSSDEQEVVALRAYNEKTLVEYKKEMQGRSKTVKHKSSPGDSRERKLPNSHQYINSSRLPTKIPNARSNRGGHQVPKLNSSEQELVSKVANAYAKFTRSKPIDSTKTPEVRSAEVDAGGKLTFDASNMRKNLLVDDIVRLSSSGQLAQNVDMNNEFEEYDSIKSDSACKITDKRVDTETDDFLRRNERIVDAYRSCDWRSSSGVRNPWSHCDVYYFERTRSESSKSENLSMEVLRSFSMKDTVSGSSSNILGSDDTRGSTVNVWPTEAEETKSIDTGSLRSGWRPHEESIQSFVREAMDNINWSFPVMAYDQFGSHGEEPSSNVDQPLYTAQQNLKLNGTAESVLRFAFSFSNDSQKGTCLDITDDQYCPLYNMDTGRMEPVADGTAMGDHDDDRRSKTPAETEILWSCSRVLLIADTGQASHKDVDLEPSNPDPSTFEVEPKPDVEERYPVREEEESNLESCIDANTCFMDELTNEKQPEASKATIADSSPFFFGNLTDPELKYHHHYDEKPTMASGGTCKPRPMRTLIQDMVYPRFEQYLIAGPQFQFGFSTTFDEEYEDVEDSELEQLGRKSPKRNQSGTAALVIFEQLLSKVNAHFETSTDVARVELCQETFGDASKAGRVQTPGGGSTLSEDHSNGAYQDLPQSATVIGVNRRLPGSFTRTSSGNTTKNENTSPVVQPGRQLESDSLTSHDFDNEWPTSVKNPEAFDQFLSTNDATVTKSEQLQPQKPAEVDLVAENQIVRLSEGLTTNPDDIAWTDSHIAVLNSALKQIDLVQSIFHELKGTLRTLHCASREPKDLEEENGAPNEAWEKFASLVASRFSVRVELERLQSYIQTIAKCVSGPAEVVLPEVKFSKKGPSEEAAKHTSNKSKTVSENVSRTHRDRTYRVKAACAPILAPRSTAKSTGHSGTSRQDGTNARKQKPEKYARKLPEIHGPMKKIAKPLKKPEDKGRDFFSTRPVSQRGRGLSSGHHMDSDRERSNLLSRLPTPMSNRPSTTPAISFRKEPVDTSSLPSRPESHATSAGQRIEASNATSSTTPNDLLIESTLQNAMDTMDRLTRQCIVIDSMMNYFHAALTNMASSSGSRHLMDTFVPERTAGDRYAEDPVIENEKMKNDSPKKNLIKRPFDGTSGSEDAEAKSSKTVRGTPMRADLQKSRDSNSVSGSRIPKTSVIPKNTTVRTKGRSRSDMECNKRHSSSTKWMPNDNVASSVMDRVVDGRTSSSAKNSLHNDDIPSVGGTKKMEELDDMLRELLREPSLQIDGHRTATQISVIEYASGRQFDETEDSSEIHALQMSASGNRDRITRLPSIGNMGQDISSLLANDSSSITSNPRLPFIASDDSFASSFSPTTSAFSLGPISLSNNSGMEEFTDDT